MRLALREALLTLPEDHLVPLCILGVNQHRSYGVCFTSLDDIGIVNGFLNDLKQNDPEAAFAWIDLEFWWWKFSGYQFEDEVMAGFEEELKATFLKQAEPLINAGGITDFKYLSTDMGIKHDGAPGGGMIPPGGTS